MGLGLGCYDADIGSAFEKTIKVIPELRESRELQQLTTVMPAILFNGHKAKIYW